MRVPILRQPDVGEFSRQHVDQRYNLMSTRHRQIAARAEVILNIDHQKDVVISHPQGIGQSAVPPRPPTYQAYSVHSNLVETSRVVDQDPLACRGIGCPDSQLIQKAPVADVEQGSKLRRLVARRCVGMRPVPTPPNPLRVGSNLASAVTSS